MIYRQRRRRLRARILPSWAITPSFSAVTSSRTDFCPSPGCRRRVLHPITFLPVFSSRLSRFCANNAALPTTCDPIPGRKKTTRMEAIFCWNFLWITFFSLRHIPSHRVVDGMSARASVLPPDGTRSSTLTTITNHPIGISRSIRDNNGSGVSTASEAVIMVCLDAGIHLSGNDEGIHLVYHLCL